MSYTVLARRYRSETFDDVVGQEAVSKTLKNAIATGRVAHAYLFTGTRGVGKTTMARILAKALNCLEAAGPTVSPCLKCDSCQAIAEGNDIDVIEIDAASNTGVDHIRELRQNAIYRPARARNKIYIIDEVHMLSTGAFNALLKTLEEPPEHVKFILATTEINKVLPTILSRCQRFDFRNIQVDDIAAQLKTVLQGEKVEAEEALVRKVARLANGSMRDALSLLDQLLSMSAGRLTLDLLTSLLGTPRSERIMNLAEAVGGGDVAGALTQVDGALGEGLALEQLADALQSHFRDLMILRNCGEKSEMVDLDDPAIREKMLAQSRKFDDAALIYYITIMEELRRSIKSSGAGRALLEAAVVRLTASDRFSDTRALLQQLQQLAGGEAPPSRAPSTTAARPTAPAYQTKAAPPVKGAGEPAAYETKTAPLAKLDSARAEPTAPITFEWLRENWQEFVTRLKTGQMYMKLAQPLAWRDGDLTLGWQEKQDGMMKLLVDKPSILADVEGEFAAALAAPVKLKLVTAGAFEAAPAPPAQKKNDLNAAPRPRLVPGSKPSQREVNQALADPQVKAVQDVLGGRVKSVERKT